MPAIPAAAPTTRELCPSAALWTLAENRVTIVARDSMAGRLSYTRRYSVRPSGCAVYARSWILVSRFRAHGRFVVSLRAIDSSGKSSRTVARSVRR